MTRERLPDRRSSWTQKVRIEGQTFYLCCGEYEDGRLGEIFLEAHKEGTFARGVLSALARMTSIALQSGVSVLEVVGALRHLNFPPRGAVAGSEVVMQCTSLTDWIAQELEAIYLPRDGSGSPVQPGQGDPEPEGKTIDYRGTGSGV